LLRGNCKWNVALKCCAFVWLSEEWKDKLFAAFGTNLAQSIEKGGSGSAEQIAKKLSEKGLKQAVPVLRPAVLGLKGPLREGEVEKAKVYAKELASKLKGKQTPHFQRSFSLSINS